MLFNEQPIYLWPARIKHLSRGEIGVGKCIERHARMKVLLARGGEPRGLRLALCFSVERWELMGSGVRVYLLGEGSSESCFLTSALTASMRGRLVLTRIGRASTSCSACGGPTT